MVDGGAGTGVGAVVCGIDRRAGSGVAGVEGAVCGLRAVAAGVAGGGGAGKAIGILEREAERGSGAGDADGPGASWGAELPRRAGEFRAFAGTDCWIGEAGAGGRGNAVHGAAGGVAGTDGEVERATRRGGRFA